MATIKINIMSIVAIILSIAAIIAIALLEVPDYTATDYTKTYLAFLITAVILAVVVLIVTCADIESATGKTFLVYALTAVLLLVGVILFGINLDDRNTNHNEHYASIVFAAIAFIAAVVGTAAPFACSK